MIPFDYAALRLGRRLLPERAVEWLRSQQVFLVPGLETRQPERAVERYIQHLNNHGLNPREKRVMVLGYGGSFGVAVGLLRRGAEHVTLVDPYAVPDRRQNERYLTQAPEYVREVAGEIWGAPQWLSIRRVDACTLADESQGRFDLILSSSVLEHVVEPERLVGCLRALTADGGAGLHFVDLRDHYFKHPFEMLCHSDSVWQRFLEPPTRLNRLRLWEYEELFEGSFPRVEVQILESDPRALAQVKPRVRPEYLSGDPERDAATKITIFCSA